MAILEQTHDLGALGIVRARRVFWNLGTAALYEEALRREEGLLAAGGPLVCRTGQHTGRSPNDKFVVREPSSERHVHWGAVNRPLEETYFDVLRRDMVAYLRNKDLFALDAWAGTDPMFRMPICVLTEFAWHSLFARNMFLRPHGTPSKHLVPGRQNTLDGAADRPENTLFAAKKGLTTRE